MVSKKYTVTLDEELVNECREFLSDAGSKLSPVINNLLDGWLFRQKELRERVNHLDEEEEE